MNRWEGSGATVARLTLRSAPPLLALALMLSLPGCGDPSAANPPAPPAKAPPASPAFVLSIIDDLEAEQQLDPDVQYGMELFQNSCASCHGTHGQGVPKQGPDLHESTFLATSDDETLLGFLKIGREAHDPENQMQLQMPAGGNPVLDETQLRRVIVYLRHLPPAPDEAEAAEASASLAD